MPLSISCRSTGITASTWRDYVADHRAPAPLPGYDPHTGRKTWDPATVRTWHSHRPGQGTRTDLTYHPDPDGHPVFINPTTITTATLLRDLTGTHATTITKKALQQRWAQQFANNNQTPPHPQPTPHATNPPATRQITKALNALNKLTAIQHDRHHITIIDHTSSLESRIWHDSRPTVPHQPAQQRPRGQMITTRRQDTK